MLQIGGYPSPSNLTNVKTGYTFVNGTKQYLWKNNTVYGSYGNDNYTGFVGVEQKSSSLLSVVFYNSSNTLCSYDLSGYYSTGYGYRFYSYGDYALLGTIQSNTLLNLKVLKINGSSLSVNTSPFPSGEYVMPVISFGSSGIYEAQGEVLYYATLNQSTLGFNARTAVSGITYSYNQDYVIKIYANGDIATFNYTTKVLKIIKAGVIVKQYDLSSIYSESVYSAILEGHTFIAAISTTQTRAYNLVTKTVGPNKNINFYNGATSPGYMRYCIMFNKLNKYRPFYQSGCSVNSDKSVNMDIENQGYYVLICRNNSNNTCVYFNENNSGTYKYTLDGKTFNTFTPPSGATMDTANSCYVNPTKGMIFYTTGSTGYVSQVYVSVDNGSTWTSITL